MEPYFYDENPDLAKEDRVTWPSNTECISWWLDLALIIVQKIVLVPFIVIKLAGNPTHSVRKRSTVIHWLKKIFEYYLHKNKYLLHRCPYTDVIVCEISLIYCNGTRLS